MFEPVLMSYALAFVKLITVSISVSSYVCIVQRFEPSIIIVIYDDNSPIHHACPLAKIISIPLSLSTFFFFFFCTLDCISFLASLGK